MISNFNDFFSQGQLSIPERTHEFTTMEGRQDSLGIGTCSMRRILLSLVLWNHAQFIVAGAASAGIWAYGRHKQKTNVHIMALNLIKDVPLRNRGCFNSSQHLHLQDKSGELNKDIVVLCMLTTFS